MKTKQLLCAMLLFAVLITSCKKDDFEKTKKNHGSAVEFTSKIIGSQATKASGNRWDANDEIGVFMKQGPGLRNVLASNKKYTTNGDGNFSASGVDIINFPASGKVDFIAYYPFTTSLSNNAVEINIGDQSNQAKIDFMYADNAKELDKNSGTANLAFSHKLSKIEILVKAGTGVTNLTGLKTVFNTVATKSSLDLSSGVISPGSTEANVEAKVSPQNADQFVEAIFIPGDNKGKKVVFSIANDNFSWTLPVDAQFEAGKKYAYTITLQESGLVKLEGNAVITNWVTVPGGSVGVDKESGSVNPPAGIEETIYFETFGTIPMSERFKFFKFNEYTGYLNKVAKYSELFNDPVDYGFVARTVKYDGFISLPARKTTGVKIENINSTGYKNVKLSFDVAAFNNNSAPIDVLKLKINGTLYPLSGALGEKNVFSNFSVPNIPAGPLVITYEASKEDNINNYFIDNIKIVGTK
mgnify:CR=1 FL=1